jgi:hypothetical protein
MTYKLDDLIRDGSPVRRWHTGQRWGEGQRGGAVLAVCGSGAERTLPDARRPSPLLCHTSLDPLLLDLAA